MVPRIPLILSKRVVTVTVSFASLNPLDFRRKEGGCQKCLAVAKGLWTVSADRDYMQYLGRIFDCHSMRPLNIPTN